MLPRTALTGSRDGCRSPRRKAGRWWPCLAAPQLLNLPRTLAARCSCWAIRRILRPTGTWSVASSPASRDVQCQGLSTDISRCHYIRPPWQNQQLCSARTGKLLWPPQCHRHVLLCTPCSRVFLEKLTGFLINIKSFRQHAFICFGNYTWLRVSVTWTIFRPLTLLLHWSNFLLI